MQLLNKLIENKYSLEASIKRLQAANIRCDTQKNQLMRVNKSIDQLLINQNSITTDEKNVTNSHRNGSDVVIRNARRKRSATNSK